jgi:HEAT repeat protein
MDADAINALIKSKNLEERLRAVRLASRLSEGERQAPLLLLLRDRANYVAALAAEALGASADWKSAGEMRERFLWLSENGEKRDSGCHIRSHLAYAFGRLEYTPGHDVLRIGLRTVQIEPVGGVPFDTAASLRANCALALAHLHDPDAVREIAPLLFDNGENRIDRILNPVGIAKRILPEVRKKMAQALAATGDPVAAIPLELKLQFPTGEAPEVLQECMQALVQLEADNTLEVLAPYLGHHDNHLAAFAALMIAQTNAPEAAALLKETIEDLYGDPLRAVILALSSLRSDEARAILRGVAEDHRMVARLALIEALNGSIDEADRACLQRLADSDSYPQVREAALAALGGA